MPAEKKIKQEILNIVGSNIRKVRKSKNMTQVELADKLKVDPGKIGRTERGEYDFKISSLIYIARGLDVKICELLENDRY